MASGSFLVDEWPLMTHPIHPAYTGLACCHQASSVYGGLGIKGSADDTEQILLLAWRATGGGRAQWKKAGTHCLHIGRRHPRNISSMLYYYIQIDTHKASVCWIGIWCELLQDPSYLNLRHNDRSVW